MTSEKTSFAGLRVAAFESRRADELARMIEKFGGLPRVSPSMREVGIDRNPEAIDFANRVITGQVESIIFMTGVGVRHLIAQTERHVGRDRFLAAMSDVTTIVRGPKSLAALKDLGLTPTHRVPEPNTWREVLQTVDRYAPVANQTVGLQEYGEPNNSLVAGLEARGARVINVKVYSWDLPEDTAPLEANIRAIIAGEIDVAMFTSGHQVANMLRTAAALNLVDDVRAAMSRVVIASIGPTTSEAIREHGFSPDLEPEHSKMGHLVMAAAEQAGNLLSQKRQNASAAATIRPATPIGSSAGPLHTGWVSTNLGTPPMSAGDSIDPAQQSVFMRTCRREPTSRTPIWLMRQAGRYMAEYREVRAKTTFLELCKNPEMCADVMITAVRRLDVDAAIIFADLLPILEPMGLDLEFAQGEGPVIHNPVREAADVDRVRELDEVDSLGFVMETVRQTKAGLPGLPILGFAGAPFTLASYAIEGGGSRNYLHVKSMMYRDEGAWTALMQKLSRAVTRYLNAQIAAGAHAVQLFDSWAGCLGPDDYRRYVLPHTRSIIQGITPGVPVINFATGNPALLPLLTEAGGTVIGVDWRINLADAWQTIGYDRAVQGNLDPLVLLAEPKEIRRRANEILRQADRRPGHIFNLGHGILPQTPVDNVIALVEGVKELSAR